ncbi:MAG: thymidylate kinase [Planctomycetaceae bacterium]|nr:thymidylate kinase [Planctomycetaceae bacterium]
MGFLVAIEGIDGSGKGTQARELVERLAGIDVSTTLLSFPRYSETLFGAAVGEFLNGAFGALDAVAPQLAATLYAGDRYESRPVLLDALEQHDVVVCDRYVPSNLAHQGARLNSTQRTALLAWIQQVEYGVFALPRPDAVIWLDLPAQITRTLISRKAARDYTTRAADIQEADSQYQADVRDVYQALCKADSSWIRIDGLVDSPAPENEMIRPVEEIAEEVLAAVKARIEDRQR